MAATIRLIHLIDGRDPNEKLAEPTWRYIRRGSVGAAKSC
jgi:hypothetical protein